MKIIDGLHIVNHKNPACRRDYNPDLFYKRFGEEEYKNTMVAEQTFSSVVKFKKQANSMTKENQLFFHHRMIVLRNRYIEDVEKGDEIGPGRRSYADRK